jgi:flagellar hook-associated protein 3 FlgL
VISTSLSYSNARDMVLAQQEAIGRLSQQLGTGARMLSPSDDPLGAAQSINVRQADAMNTTFKANRGSASDALGNENNTLNSVVLNLQSSLQTVVAAGNLTISDTARAAYATQLQSLRDALLGLANTKDGSGTYMFSGYNGASQPFNADGSYAIPDSANQQRLVQVNSTRQLSNGDVGSDVFARANPGAQGYIATAGASNVGTGTFSQISFDPKGANATDNFTVTFSNDAAGNLQYTAVGTPTLPNTSVVIDATALTANVAASTGGAAGGTIVGGVQVADDGKYYVQVTGGATDGLYEVNIDSAGAATLAPATTPTTPAPTNLTPTTTAMVFGPPVTIGPKPYVDGEPIDLDGAKFSVTGTPAVNDTIEVDTNQSADVNVFKTLDDLIAAMKKPMDNDPVARAALSNQLATANKKLNTVYDNIGTVLASVGARQNEITDLNTIGNTQTLSNAKRLSDIENVDIVSAYSEMALRQTALLASTLATKAIQSSHIYTQS